MYGGEEEPKKNEFIFVEGPTAGAKIEKSCY